jgi:hypothetical protein
MVEWKVMLKIFLVFIILAVVLYFILPWFNITVSASEAKRDLIGASEDAPKEFGSFTIANRPVFLKTDTGYMKIRKLFEKFDTSYYHTVTDGGVLKYSMFYIYWDVDEEGQLLLSQIDNEVRLGIQDSVTLEYHDNWKSNSGTTGSYSSDSCWSSGDDDFVHLENTLYGSENTFNSGKLHMRVGLKESSGKYYIKVRVCDSD